MKIINQTPQVLSEDNVNVHLLTQKGTDALQSLLVPDQVLKENKITLGERREIKKDDLIRLLTTVYHLKENEIELGDELYPKASK